MATMIDGHELDESDLVAVLTPYYVSGERIEVTYTEDMGDSRMNDGRSERFYVGKSTGWKPIYLKIKTRTSSGGLPFGDYEAERIERIVGLGVYRDWRSGR